MTAANFPKAMALIFAVEGPFTDNPKDKGGPTNLGVTLAAWSDYCGHACSVQDIRALTRATVTPLYKTRYWDAVHGDHLPSGVDLICFDGAVNQGVGAISRMLQHACGAVEDGNLGPRTLFAVAAVAPRTLITRLYAERLASYKADGAFATFGHGWTNRLTDVTKTASAWASVATA